MLKAEQGLARALEIKIAQLYETLVHRKIPGN